MPCYRPLRAQRRIDGTVKIIGAMRHTQTASDEISIACGQCVGCRIDHSKEWMLRCTHEASQHDSNHFVTLTYENEPYGGSLIHEHYQRFMKRLRKKMPAEPRYYMCGEYGDQLQRPHFHACLFNVEFPDAKLYKIQNGHRLYESDLLNEIWATDKQHDGGFCLLGDVTTESAAYVARYVMKKRNGKDVENIDPQSGLRHYERLVEETGEIIELRPEYAKMSLKPGIGIGWYDKYKDETYRDDFIVDNNGKKHRPPRYYDKLFSTEDKEHFEAIQSTRKANGELRADDNTPERLRAKEKCVEARISNLKRPLDEENA